MLTENKNKQIKRTSLETNTTRLGSRWTPPKSNSPITITTTPPSTTHPQESLSHKEINLFAESRPETPSKLVLIIPHNYVEEIDCDSSALKVILPDTAMTLTTLPPTHVLQLGTEALYSNHHIAFPNNKNSTNDVLPNR